MQSICTGGGFFPCLFIAKSKFNYRLIFILIIIIIYANLIVRKTPVRGALFVSISKLTFNSSVCANSNNQIFTFCYYIIFPYVCSILLMKRWLTDHALPVS